jgi:hypothetical protein
MNMTKVSTLLASMMFCLAAHAAPEVTTPTNDQRTGVLAPDLYVNGVPISKEQVHANLVVE